MSKSTDPQNRDLSKKRAKRLGWALTLIGSLMIFLLPIDGIAAYVGSFLVTRALFLLIVMALFIGTCLFIFSYRPFFKSIKGVLLYFTWLTLGARLLAYLNSFNEPSWLNNRIHLLNASWLFVVPFALGLALLTYLYYQDKAVPILAVFLLACTWGLAAYIYYRGPLQLFDDLALVQVPMELWTILCSCLWLQIIVPLSFLGHSLRLIDRECSRKDMDSALQGGKK